IPHVAQFADEGPLSLAESLREDLMPLIPHGSKKGRDIEGRRVPFQSIGGSVAITAGLRGVLPLFPMNSAKLPFHKRSEPSVQQCERLSNALVVAESHVPPSTCRLCASADPSDGSPRNRTRAAPR